MIDDNQKVNIDAENDALSKVLNEMLVSTSILYKVMDDGLVVLSSAGNDDTDAPQQIIIGKITDADGRL